MPLLSVFFFGQSKRTNQWGPPHNARLLVRPVGWLAIPITTNPTSTILSTTGPRSTAMVRCGDPRTEPELWPWAETWGTSCTTAPQAGRATTREAPSRVVTARGSHTGLPAPSRSLLCMALGGNRLIT
jgi:hypothetical protein